MGVDSEIACGIVGNIGLLWLDEEFIDLQINIDGVQFNCNQFILCACSEFFKVLLKSEVKDEVKHHVRQVTIRGISPEIFQLVLKALYTGENGLNTENMIELWHAVHQLQIPVLVSLCETFVISHMTRENFLNIHQNAFGLKSTNMTTAVHQFVAKNFDYFKDLDILLQQPANIIEEIIGGDSLVVESQNQVVEFILKWVNYELCASETEHACAESTIGDLSTQKNESTRNTNGSVEVIFQKPHTAGGEDHIRHLSEQPLVRKQSLGKLLKLVRFSKVSKDSLEILADNDLVMSSKETRDIVRQAVELVNSATTSDTDTEYTVVFVTKDDIRTINAYSLDSGDIFEFLFCDHICNINTQHNHLLCRTLYDHRYQGHWVLKMYEFPFSKKVLELGSVESDSVIVGDFCYTVRENHMYRKNISYYRWYRLVALPEDMPSPSLTVFKDSILYYNSEPDKDGKQTVYCFNTNSRRHWQILTCNYEDCNFVTLIHGDLLYILYGNGVFWNITDSVVSPAEAVSLCEYSEISKHLPLWDFQFQIHGAVVDGDNLMVFGDLSSLSVSEISECKIPGLKAIKFVHLYGLLTKCHPLVIPKNMLTQRM